MDVAFVKDTDSDLSALSENYWYLCFDIVLCVVLHLYLLVLHPSAASLRSCSQNTLWRCWLCVVYVKVSGFLPRIWLRSGPLICLLIPAELRSNSSLHDDD